MNYLLYKKTFEEDNLTDKICRGKYDLNFICCYGSLTVICMYYFMQYISCSQEILYEMISEVISCELVSIY